MIKLKFEWDLNKEESNTKKHGVSFSEAKTVFYDQNAIQFFDPEHSESEERFILLGTSSTSNTVVVCHCFREEETVVRIISARKADRVEERAYWGEKK